MGRNRVRLRVRHVKLNIGYNIAVGIQHHVAELGGLTANIAAEKRGGGRKHQAAVVEHTGRYVDCAELTKRTLAEADCPSVPGSGFTRVRWSALPIGSKVLASITMALQKTAD